MSPLPDSPYDGPVKAVHDPVPKSSADIAPPPDAGVITTAATVILALVPAVTAGPATLAAVTVCVPAVFNVTVKSNVPPTRSSLEGSVAAPSDEVI